MKKKILESVDSTNSWVKREPLSEPTCVIAREQTGGRGRYGNSWLSPKDTNLYLTYSEPLRFSLITYLQASALALQKAVASFGISAQIKWPNDLLINGEKLAGILVEGTSKENQPWAIVGIGLNVNMDKKMLSSLNRSATSLLLCTRKPLSLQSVQEKVLSELLSTLQSSDIEERWKEECSWIIGTKTTIQTSTKKITGTVEKISPSGELLLRTEGGCIQISQGEILS